MRQKMGLMSRALQGMYTLQLKASNLALVYKLTLVGIKLICHI